MRLFLSPPILPRLPLEGWLIVLVTLLLAAACTGPPQVPAPPDTAPELEAQDLFQALYAPVTPEDSSEDAPEEPPPLLTRPLIERLAHYRVPSVSVAVIDGGELRFAKTWSGLNSVNSPSPQSSFQAGSLSKLIAATLALRLAHQGRLDLDSPLTDQFASLIDSKALALDSTVSVRQALSHTSGLGPVSFAGYSQQADLPSSGEILTGEAPANHSPLSQEFAPGASWRYSGGGYQLVQRALELASDRKYQDLAKLEVFAPLEMAASSFLQPIDPRTAALGHDVAGVPVPGGWKAYPEHAAAGLWSTPTDLAMWVIDVQKAFAGKPARRLNKAMAREMMEAQVPGGWGLGPQLGGEGHSSWFAHLGGSAGFRCFAIGFVSSGHGAVVMTNGDGGLGLIREVVAGLATLYDWPAFKPKLRPTVALERASLEALSGRFSMASAPDYAAEIHLSDGSLEMSLFGASSQLLASDRDNFFDLEQGWQVKVLERDDADQAIGLEVATFPAYRFTATREPATAP